MRIELPSSADKVREETQPNPQNWPKDVLRSRLSRTIRMPRLNSEEKLLRAVFGRPRGDARFILIDIFIESNEPGADWKEYRDSCRRWAAAQDSELRVPKTSAMRESICNVLDTLSPREKKVIWLRFGFVDGRSRTLKEVGKEFRVTLERVRQIEAKALRKLRHPGRGRQLRPYLQDEAKTHQDLYNRLVGQFPGDGTIEALCRPFLEDSAVWEKRELEVKAQRRKVAREKALAFPKLLASLPEGDAEQLTGFLEGDAGMSPTNQDTLWFNQKDRRILDYYNDLLQLPKPVRYDRGTNLHVISVDKAYRRPLQALLCKYLVVTYRIQQIREASDKYNLRLKPVKHTPGIRWIVGIFDAEGCFHPQSRTNLGVKVGQQDAGCLEGIRQVIGGHISKNGWELNLRKDEAWKFLPIYIQYSRNPEKLERLYSVLYWMQEQPTPKGKRGRKPKPLPEGITLDGVMKDLKTKLGKWNE